MKMNDKKAAGGNDPEFHALAIVFDALKSLDQEGQIRVLDYVSKKLGLSNMVEVATPNPVTPTNGLSVSSISSAEPSAASVETVDTAFDGISPIAIKWIRRNNITVEQLAQIFSLGADEIDLVAKSIPGSGKRARTRNVILLKGVSAYLSTGVSRISNEQIKEACLHYDAFDQTNYAKYLKDMGSELNGNKESGYTLSPRGLTSATELLKEIVSSKAEKT